MLFENYRREHSCVTSEKDMSGHNTLNNPLFDPTNPFGKKIQQLIDEGLISPNLDVLGEDPDQDLVDKVNELLLWDEYVGREVHFAAELQLKSKPIRSPGEYDSPEPPPLYRFSPHWIVSWYWNMKFEYQYSTRPNNTDSPTPEDDRFDVYNVADLSLITDLDAEMPFETKITYTVLVDEYFDQPKTFCSENISLV